jgi:hypothetical protein
MDPEDPGQRAAERAASAGRRTRELSERLTRLAAGQPSDVHTLREAQEQAEMAVERARVAAERAQLGHERAARTHERTAERHESAARLGSGDVGGHRDRAAHHRQAAEEDRRAAEHEPVDVHLGGEPAGGPV